jgi:hypothetical protein
VKIQLHLSRQLPEVVEGDECDFCIRYLESMGPKNFISRAIKFRINELKAERKKKVCLEK